MLRTLALSIAFSCFAMPAHAELVTIKEAVSKALLSSPTYITAKNSLEAAKLESKNAFAAFLPSLDLTSSHGVSGTEQDTVSIAALTLTENLYNNGESITRNEIANYNFEAASLEYQQTKAQVLTQVVLAYYRYNLTSQNLIFTQKNYAELERLARLVSQQFHQGMKTRKDYLSFKTRAQRGRLDVLKAEENLTDARSILLQTIGLPPNSAVEFETNIKPVLPPPQLSLSFSPTELYEARILDIQQKRNELEVRLAKRKYWPELNLVGAASYGSYDYLEPHTRWSDNDSTEWSVLLNLNFNLIDWGVRSRNIRIATVNQSSIEQTYRTRLMTAEKDLQTFKAEAERANETYKLAKELQQMEEDTFKLLERDYRTGTASYLELTTGLANLLDAQSRGQEADFDQANLYLRWKYYKGTLSENTIFE